LTTLTFGQVPFDFSDDFYRANGIDPDKIFERIGDDSFGGIANTAPDANFTDVRNISVTGGYDSGALQFSIVYLVRYFQIHLHLMPQDWKR